MANGDLIEGLSSPFFIDAHNKFAESKFGEELVGRPRWDRYRPPHIAEEEWIDLLGPDADNLQHLPYSYWTAAGFIVDSNEFAERSGGVGFNEEEEQILLLAALCNGWGEADPLIGHITYEHKTVDDIAAEKKAFGPIFESILGEGWPKHRYAVEEVLYGSRDSKLGQAWDAIERITYMHDILQAYRASLSVDDDVLRSHLHWMVAGALPNQTGLLLEYTKVMPAVRHYLQTNEAIISEAYDSLDPTIFARHGQKEKVKIEQFLFERGMWQRRGTHDAHDIEIEIEQGLADLPPDTAAKIIRLIHTYGELRAHPAESVSHGSRSDTFDRGIFGTGTNFEARFLPDLEAVERVVGAVRTLGLRIVLTSGTFDMWHIGHARYIELAKAHGDFLIVGVDSDEKIQQRKGPGRPVVPEAERLEIVAHERSVDVITLKHVNELKWALIKAVRPDTLILTAETYSDTTIKELEEYCGRVVVLPPQATTSTSARIRSLHMDIGNRLVHVLPGYIEKIVREIVANG